MSTNTILASAPLTATGYHLKANGTTLGQSLIWDNGTNVGIGNTNTSYTLDVTGTINATKTLTLRGQTDPTSGVGMELFYRSADTSSYLQSYDRTSSAWKDVRIYGNALYIGTQGNNTLTIASNGTTTLSGDLTIAARMYIKGGNQNSIWFNQNAGGSSTGFLVGRSLANTDAQDFFIYDIAAATARLQITSGGNVGIGTSSPGEKFTVQTTANNWTGNFIGNTTSGQSLGLLITAGTNSADSAFYIQNSSGSFNSFKVRGDGWLVSPTTYNNTSGVAANVGIDSAGNIFRATSSIKYKTNIKPYDKGLDSVLLMNPIYYKSKSDFDGDKQFAGFIAEEIDELGLKEFVQYNDENNEPEGLNYGNITAILVKAIQEMNTKLDEQNQTIQSLQEQINILAK